jgi:pimeloyl-[acyl-carrier protein] methyl ester esterase
MSSAFSSADLEAGLRYLAAADLRAELARIALPTIVLHGDADRVIPPAAGRLLAESLPAARHVAIRGAGHALPLSHPEAVARAVLETIDAVAAAR